MWDGTKLCLRATHFTPIASDLVIDQYSVANELHGLGLVKGPNRYDCPGNPDED